MSYKINDIFYSIQSEGARAGTPNIFLRFTGCNLICSLQTHGFDCDTEFESGRKLSLEEIIKECNKFNCKSIILTGGEPALQIDQKLIKELKKLEYYIAIETNGTKLIDLPIDWITLSPKVAEHAIRQLECSEIKYVRSYGQEIPKTKVIAKHYYISPAFVGNYLPEENANWCVELVKKNPQWKLSLQYHKFLNIA